MGIFVAMPSLHGVRAETTVAVAALMVKFSRVWPDSELMIFPGCSDLRVARSELAHQFLETELGWTLLLDDDLVVTEEVVSRMFNVDTDIVVAGYKKRGPSSNFALRLLPGLKLCHPIFSPFRIAGGERLIEIEAAGLGCALIKRHVIEEICRRHPELEYTSHGTGKTCVLIFQPGFWEAEGLKRPLGDDFSFFKRAREAGFKVELLVDARTDHAGKPGNMAEFFPPRGTGIPITDVSPKDVLAGAYTRIVHPIQIPEVGTEYAARLAEFNLDATGKTPEEASEKLEALALRWIEVSLLQGTPIPPPFGTPS